MEKEGICLRKKCKLKQKMMMKIKIKFHLQLGMIQIKLKWILLRNKFWLKKRHLIFQQNVDMKYFQTTKNKVIIKANVNLKHMNYNKNKHQIMNLVLKTTSSDNRKKKSLSVSSRQQLKNHVQVSLQMKTYPRKKETNLLSILHIVEANQNYCNMLFIKII